jgi:hypothetical protein
MEKQKTLYALNNYQKEMVKKSLKDNGFFTRKLHFNESSLRINLSEKSYLGNNCFVFYYNETIDKSILKELSIFQVLLFGSIKGLIYSINYSTLEIKVAMIHKGKVDLSVPIVINPLVEFYSNTEIDTFLNE